MGRLQFRIHYYSNLFLMSKRSLSMGNDFLIYWAYPLPYLYTFFIYILFVLAYPVQFMTHEKGFHRLNGSIWVRPLTAEPEQQRERKALCP